LKVFFDRIKIDNPWMQNQDPEILLFKSIIEICPLELDKNKLDNNNLFNNPPNRKNFYDFKKPWFWNISTQREFKIICKDRKETI
jgi:hypothetical protein